jgi:PleD family two-component response regulator
MQKYNIQGLNTFSEKKLRVMIITEKSETSEKLKSLLEKRGHHIDLIDYTDSVRAISCYHENKHDIIFISQICDGVTDDNTISEIIKLDLDIHNKSIIIGMSSEDSSLLTELDYMDFLLFEPINYDLINHMFHVFETCREKKRIAKYMSDIMLSFNFQICKI